MLRPAVPKRRSAAAKVMELPLLYSTGRKASGLNQDVPGPALPRIVVAPTMSGVCVLPGAFREDAPPAVTVNGRPATELKMPLNCQPPRIADDARLSAHFLPLPNGSSAAEPSCKMSGMS